MNKSRFFCFYLCDVGESNDVGNNAHGCNEYLSALSEDVRELIHQRGDESFHGAELETVQSHIKTFCKLKVASKDYQYL